MKKIKLLFFLKLLIVLSISGCGNNDNHNYPITLKATDSLKIEFQDSIPIYSPGSSWNYNHNSLSFSSSTPTYIIIDTYYLNKKEWIRTYLNKEGPEGVKNAGGFEIKNDTLIYATAGYSNFFLFNLNGTLIKEVKYGDRETSLNIKEWNPKFYKNKKNFGFSTVEYEALSSDVSTYQKSKLYSIVNIDSNTVRHIISYPEEFHNKIWSSNDNSYTAISVGDTIIMNFSKSHFLYLYDLEGNLISSKEAKNPMVRDAMPMKSSSSQKNSLINEVNGHYNKLIYDKYRKVYYRTSIAYDTTKNLENPTEFTLFSIYSKKKLCITTLDENFNIIGMNYFKGRQGGLGDILSFVNEEGLYLWFLHKNNENEENFIKFNIKKQE